MHRVLLTFWVLLGVATLASGQFWIQSKTLAAGPGTVLNGGLAILLALLIVTLLALGRILYRVSRPAPVKTAQGRKEE